MGAGVSAGENNDDLIDNLKEANYIRTPIIDRVFRAVDRGDYFIPEHHVNPYRDVAWKNGHFHISAPCIYSEVLEGLQLQAGFSFLNLGSGTGYLNTVAGLILGHNGINHGVELHDDLITYANTKLEDFKRYSGALDEFDFCEPKFMKGNCLNIASGGLLYDRVYCGAACPEPYLNYIKNLIKVGGSLIVPLNEELLRLDRVSETEWNSTALIPVSFASLILPQGQQEMIRLFDVQPLSLQELCRGKIRNNLRKTIEMEKPNIRDVKKPVKIAKKRKPHRRPNYQTFRESEELFDYFLLTVTRRKQRLDSLAENVRASDSSTAPEDTTRESSSPESSNSASDNRTSSDAEGTCVEDSSERTRGMLWAKNATPTTFANSCQQHSDGPLSGMQEIFVDVLNSFDSASPTEPNHAPESENRTNEETSEKQTNPNFSAFEKMEEDEPNPNIHIVTTAEIESERVLSHPVEIAQNIVEEVPCCSGESKRKKNSREKLDSGLGDEIISESSVMITDEVDDLTTSSSDDEDSASQGYRRNSKRSKCLKVDTDREYESSDNEGEAVKLQDTDKEEESSDNDGGSMLITNEMRMFKSAYSAPMEDKIRSLPLPYILKRYLNFFRDI